MPRKPQNLITRRDVETAKLEGFFMGVNTASELILGKKPASLRATVVPKDRPVGSKHRRRDRSPTVVIDAKKAA